MCVSSLLSSIASLDDPFVIHPGSQRWTRYAVVGARSPACVVQDVLFSDVAGIRSDWPNFSSWAVRLFDDWAPLASVPIFDPYDGTCIRWTFRGVDLEPPLEELLEVVGGAHFCWSGGVAYTVHCFHGDHCCVLPILPFVSPIRFGLISPLGLDQAYLIGRNRMSGYGIEIGLQAMLVLLLLNAFVMVSNDLLFFVVLSSMLNRSLQVFISHRTASSAT